jgi:hypothetical protein
MLQFLDFKVKLGFKVLKAKKATRVIQVLKAQRVIRVSLDHKESVESLVEAEKAMIHLQDNILDGHIIKTDQINLLF